MNAIDNWSPAYDLQIHQLRTRIRFRNVTFLILSLFGFLVAVGVWRWLFALQNYGPASIGIWVTRVYWYWFLLMFLSIVAIINLRRFHAIELHVSPSGLVIQKKRILETIKWHDVSHIKTSFEGYGLFGLPWGGKSELQIITEDGRHYRFDQSFDAIDSLFELTKHYVYPILFEKYRESFNQGEPLNFGPLVLTTQGILNARKALHWVDLGKINLQDGFLHLRLFENIDGPNFSVFPHKIPNSDLCLQLIQLMARQS